VMSALARGEELETRRRGKRNQRLKQLKVQLRELRRRARRLERERDRLAARVSALESRPLTRARVNASRMIRGS
jgi:hypothetical protein